jgi:WhiB family transcriptional regulator, redox-sensing transcriptional regulator
VTGLRYHSLADTDTAWMTRRNCRGVDMFPGDGAGVVAAKRICEDCPVKQRCLDYALANKIAFGVFGGTSERERRRMLKARRRAA